jgi:hypothetical protein
MDAETVASFMGQNFKYSEIAIRDNETIGICLQFGVHPQTRALFAIIRFVCIADGAYAECAKFKHFTSRGMSLYTKETGKQTQGHKLNRVLIPIATGQGTCPHTVRAIGDHFEIWTVLANWITEQLDAEGFVLSVFNLPQLLRECTPDPVDQVTLALELPKDINQAETAPEEGK